MILPLDEIIDFKGNRYELTCAAIKRAIQLNLTKDEELKKNKNKIVPTALRQIFSGKIKYKLEEEIY
ncbi:MAG TPA: DNA-directed RNA polymerase subunit omega [Spirochaetota bacterium]|nr:DNA-directed RNA polymerase subunit omega [Spirochaetota bacterium]HOL56710.1 DNA-directed RNA polymerase subunit omega [Spirochaetota bacterium]HPP04105.1 DNA-directed RNA polymerase subunit omega [Spirochaetota bacterium]